MYGWLLVPTLFLLRLGVPLLILLAVSMLVNSRAAKRAL